MSEEFKQDNPQGPAHAEQDVISLIKKLQQQISFLEKKIDMLIGQSQERPSSFREGRFPRPQRSFGHSYHRGGEGERREGSGERGFDQKRHFGKPRSEEHRGFGPKRKPFFQKRRDRD